MCCCCLSLLFLPYNSTGVSRATNIQKCFARYSQFSPELPAPQGLRTLFICIRNPDIYLMETFDDCVKAGYPVVETFPARCVGPNGMSFTDTSEFIDLDTPAPTPTPVPMLTPTPAPSESSLDVVVYYSSDPESYEDPTYSVPVDRTSNRTDIGTYTIEELISGPTSAERMLGLFTPIELGGTSNCDGDDFTLIINQQTKKARLQFCKEIVSAGIGDDARIISTVNGTLTQFSTVDEVIILTRDGNCFGDESGMNQCLE